MTNAAIGAFADLYVEDGDGSPAGTGQQTFDSSSERYEFLSESMGSTTAILDGLGIHGSRSLSKNRLRRGIRQVGGTILLQPSPTDLNFWLPRIMWKAEAADTFALGDSALPFGMLIDRVSDRGEYVTCYVNRATFRAQVGGLLELELDIIATEEYTKNTTPTAAGALPATKPTFATGANGQPWSFHELAVLLPVATSEQVFNVELTIDNALDARFTNSQTVSSICPTDRVITLNCTVPYDSTHEALYRSEAGGAGSLTFTNGSSVLTFTFVDLQGPDQAPNVTGKGEIVLNLGFTARNNATDVSPADGQWDENELVITNVLT